MHVHTHTHTHTHNASTSTYPGFQILLFLHIEKKKKTTRFRKKESREGLNLIFGFKYSFVYLFIYFGCHWSSLSHRLSLVAGEWALLFVAGQGLWDAQLQWLQCAGLEHRLNSCSPACGIFLDQGLNPGFLHWQADSLPLSPSSSG